MAPSCNLNYLGDIPEISNKLQRYDLTIAFVNTICMICLACL
ncbi:hypothetical protein PROVRETT_06682 [Providencia rettgeri DSM 1131]|nr:hypothetical protein PROVRETT_06682 [Providencia rettgeri DSM 1131]